MSDVEEGTLVIYHGTVRAYRGDLAFVREWSIAPDDRRHFVLDTVCYDQNATAEYERITTYGSIDAVREEFTVIDLPGIPKPTVSKFLPEPSRFAVLPLDDPGYEDLWGIYDFYKCEWAGSVYGDRYQSADFELLSELCYVRNREEDNRYSG